MKQKIIDTSVSVSDGGRAKEYWGTRVLNPKKASQEDKMQEVDMVAILKRYNLKGFEFGNWMSNNDRYDFVHAFTRAFQTLETIVGSKNLGMDMLLGVAFGARGRGGAAAAHYEPGHNMINLTKPSGAGALAHEWGHAIDFDLGRYVDQNKKYNALTGGSSMACTIPDNTGAQLRYYANAVVDEIKASKSYERIKDKDDYWHRRTEVWARFCEQYICYQCKVKKLPTSFLCESWTSYCSAPAYLTEEDFLRIARGKMYDFMVTLRGVLNNKFKLPACTYAYYSKDHKHSSTLYEPLKSAKKAEAKKEPKKPVAKKSAAKKATEKCDDKLPTGFAALKKQYPGILLFRRGDNYECYKEDADIVCKIIGTTRQMWSDNKGKPYPYTVFSFRALDVYLPKLVRAGHKVRIATYEAPKQTVEKIAPAKTKKPYQKPSTTAKAKEAPKPAATPAKKDEGKGYGYFSGKEWYDKAVFAHYWGSFEPEKRGQQDCEMYGKALEKDLEEFVPKAYHAEYIKAFQSKVAAIWAAESKVASSAVTGAAKFNVRKHDKAAATWTKREEEFTSWRAAKKKYFAKVAKSNRTADEKQSDDLKECKKIVNSALSLYIHSAQWGNTSASYAASRAYDSLERRALSTKDAKLMEQVLTYIREVNETLKKNGKKPLFTDRHKVWKLPEVARNAAGKREEALAKGDEKKEYDGFTVIKNVEENRLQIDFDEKPKAEVIALLKKRAFKWSARNGVWQRQLTANCAYEYKNHILPELKKFYGIA